MRFSHIQTLTLLLVTYILCLFATGNAFNVELFEQKHFKGKHISLDVRGCTNLPTEWEDIVDSVEPTECIVIFKNPNCQGPRVRLEQHAFGAASLKAINFEDKMSSIAPCSFANNKDL